MIRRNASSMKAVSALSVLTMAASAPAAVFNVSTSLANGATLSGTVTIDTKTGQTTAADLTATVPTTFALTTATAIPNYQGTGLTAVQALYNNGYPVAVLAAPVPSFVNYAGGPISTSSGVFSDPTTRFALTSGSFTRTGTLTSGGRTVGAFDVSGTLTSGGSLGGNFTLDLGNGQVIGSNITATIPVTYKLSSYLSTTPNYQGTGLNAIQVATADATVIALLAEPVSTFVNYAGGSISSSSGLFVNNTRYALLSGQLTATPEPAALSLLAAAGMIATARRGRQTPVSRLPHEPEA